MSFLVFLTMGFHHLNLLVNNTYNQPDLEQIFTFAISILVFFTPSQLCMRASATKCAGLSFCLWAWQLTARLRFGISSGKAPLFILRFQQNSLCCFFSFQWSCSCCSWPSFRCWTKRSRLDKLFHVLALLYTGILTILYLGNLWQIGWLPHTTEFTNFLSYGAIFIPLINASAAQLKFGRVSLVLTGTLQYVVLSVLVLLLYFLLHLFLGFLWFTD